MHKDEFHYAWAHYGLRNQRYKLIYWYNSALGQEGAFEGDEPRGMGNSSTARPIRSSSFNIADDPTYADVFRSMLRELDAKMAEIGDIPEHTVRDDEGNCPMSEDGDRAFRADSLRGRWPEMTYGGALSFMRRSFSRDLAAADVVVSGVPYDAAVT